MIRQETYKGKYDQDFQLKILALIARDESFVRQYNHILEPAHFEYAHMVAIAEIILNAYRSYGVIPSSTTVNAKVNEYIVSHKSDEGFAMMLRATMGQLYMVDLSDRLILAAEVVRFGKLQAVKGNIMEVVRRLSGKDDNIDEILGILRKTISYGHDHDTDVGINVIPNMPDIPRLYQSDQMYSTEAKIPIFSIPTLNHCMNGGAGRGQVFGVMGYPGVGKSTLMRTFARDAMAINVPVMHYTICDLSAMEVALRYSALLTNMTVEDVIKGSQNYRDRVSAFQQYRHLLKVKEFRPRSVPVEAIRSHLTELKATENWQPGIIIVDYPDKLAPSLSKEDRWTNEAYNIDILVDIAKEFNATVYWAWHPTKDASRDKVNAREMSDDYLLTMADGKGAFEKSHGVDGVFSLNINKHERPADNQIKGRARLWIDKLRRGKLLQRPINCVTDFSIGYIAEAKL